MQRFDREDHKHKFDELKADYDPHEDDDQRVSFIKRLIIRYYTFFFWLLASVLVFIGVLGIFGLGELTVYPPGRVVTGIEEKLYSIIFLIIGIALGAILWHRRRKKLSR